MTSAGEGPAGRTHNGTARETRIAIDARPSSLSTALDAIGETGGSSGTRDVL
jgi:hypothetical protein